MPSLKASAIGTNRLPDGEEPEPEAEQAVETVAAIRARPRKALRTAASQKKVWEEDSELEGNLDTEMPDFP